MDSELMARVPVDRSDWGPNYGSESGRVLYLVVCGAGPAADTEQLVEQKQNEGWDVCVVASAHGIKWFDANRIEELTGHPVRRQFRHPTDDVYEPPGDAILLSPATFNTINKWAQGINDTIALGLLNEALGLGVPIEVHIEANDALRAHPAFENSVATLAARGVVFHQ